MLQLEAISIIGDHLTNTLEDLAGILDGMDDGELDESDDEADETE